MANYKYALGRRKTASATVRVFKGKGESTINGKKVEEVYSRAADQFELNRPFKAIKAAGEYFFTAKTTGGGISGQIDSITLGISRALVKENEALKPLLKAEGLLTRDPRMVERKKTGLKKARKAPQFSKR